MLLDGIYLFLFVILKLNLGISGFFPDDAVKDCKYLENGHLLWDIGKSDYTLTIDFYVPPNWEILKLNNEFVIVMLGIVLVLSHPLNRQESKWASYNQQSVHFLPVDHLYIGWNRIKLINKEDLIVRDPFGNVWFQSRRPFPDPNLYFYRSYGMFSFVNCESDSKYFHMDSDVKTPFVLFNKQAKIGIYSNTSIEVIINSNNNKSVECSCPDKNNNGNDTNLQTSETDSCVRCDERLGIYSSRNSSSNVSLNLYWYDKKNSLTIGGYTFAEILFHGFEKEEDFFRLESIFTTIPYDPKTSYVQSNVSQGLRMEWILIMISAIIICILVVVFIAYIKLKRNVTSKPRSNIRNIFIPKPPPPLQDEYEEYEKYEADPDQLKDLPEVLSEMQKIVGRIEFKQLDLPHEYD